jgi:NAD(P)-dependent dehydrogenase (short-subunit alcohol dehydrogenase family)
LIFANNRLNPVIKNLSAGPTFALLKSKTMDNKNKIALVTGGSRGLGKDMALRLAEKGIGVVITYHTRKDDAEAVVAQLQKAGVNAASLQLNTGDTKSFSTFFEQLTAVLKETFGADKFDFLVNNGGIGYAAPFAESTEEAFDELINVHLKGVYFLTQKALPALADGGGIVNISSGLARFTTPGSSAYASIKGGVEVLTRYMAKELAPRGIRANVVAPGAIATDFRGGAIRDSEQASKMVASINALGRVGVAEDIGGLVAFLCTEDARWITGQRIEASGGMQM